MGRSWQSTPGDTATANSARPQLPWEWQGGPASDTCVAGASWGRTPVVLQSIDRRLPGWQRANDPSKAITFGDGTPLDREAVEVATRIGDELSFDLQWRRGDVALVDNYRTMHGRRPFAGTRKVLASLIAGQ
jgi:hypothetical protein